MPTALSADYLMRHVRALADEIGPRPAGHPEEAQARAYVSAQLNAFGFEERVSGISPGGPKTILNFYHGWHGFFIFCVNL